MAEEQRDVQGHRIPSPDNYDVLKEGDYFKSNLDSNWYVCLPTVPPNFPFPLTGNVPNRTWTVVEHEDGTISATPSLLLIGHWHGFLTKGFFKSC